MTANILLILGESMLKGAIFYTLCKLNNRFLWVQRINEKYFLMLFFLLLTILPAGMLRLPNHSQQAASPAPIESSTPLNQQNISTPDIACDITLSQENIYSNVKSGINWDIKYLVWGYALIVGIILWFKLTRLVYANIFLRRLPKITNFAIKNDCGAIEIFCGDSISSSPASGGFFRKLILLPEKQLGNYSQQEVSWLIGHEKAHFYYFDHWCKLFFYLAGALFWFNPFFFMLRKELFAVMEHRCDEKVINDFKLDKKEKIAYLKMLTDFTFSGSLLLTNYLGSNAQSLKERIEAIMLDKKNVKKSLSVLCILLIFGIIIATIMPRLSRPENIAATGQEQELVDLRQAENVILNQGKSNNSLVIDNSLPKAGNTELSGKQEEVIKLLEENLKLIQGQYRNGTESQSSVLEAEEALLEARVKFYDQPGDIAKLEQILLRQIRDMKEKFDLGYADLSSVRACELKLLNFRINHADNNQKKSELGI